MKKPQVSQINGQKMKFGQKQQIFIANYTFIFSYKGAEPVAVDNHAENLLKKSKANEKATGQSNKCLENEFWAKIANFQTEKFTLLRL